MVIFDRHVCPQEFPDGRLIWCVELGYYRVRLSKEVANKLNVFQWTVESRDFLAHKWGILEAGKSTDRDTAVREVERSVRWSFHHRQPIVEQQMKALATTQRHLEQALSGNFTQQGASCWERIRGNGVE